MLTDPDDPNQTDILVKSRSARENYPAIWQALIEDWQSDQVEDAAWLTYSANYLLRTAGYRWALDPFSLFTRIGGETQSNFSQDLSPVKMIAFSHAHRDHVDHNIIAALKGKPILWVIPSFMLHEIASIANLPQDAIIIAQPGKPIVFDNLTLTPFESRHFHADGGVQELGYIAQFSKKCWVFPGDVRTFDPVQIPCSCAVDGVVAHLWLGKGRARDEDFSSILDFCRFFQAFAPNQVIITHMEDLGRDESDFWDMRHFKLIFQKWRGISPNLKIFPALTGQRFVL